MEYIMMPITLPQPRAAKACDQRALSGEMSMVRLAQK